MKHEVPPKLGFNAYIADAYNVISFSNVMKNTALPQLMKIHERTWCTAGNSSVTR